MGQWPCCMLLLNIKKLYYREILMQTNELGFVASLLFVLVPTLFLIVLYIQTTSRNTGS
jgi:photosystem II PsbM protein